MGCEHGLLGLQALDLQQRLGRTGFVALCFGDLVGGLLLGDGKLQRRLAHADGTALEGDVRPSSLGRILERITVQQQRSTGFALSLGHLLRCGAPLLLRGAQLQHLAFSHGVGVTQLSHTATVVFVRLRLSRGLCRHHGRGIGLGARLLRLLRALGDQRSQALQLLFARIIYLHASSALLLQRNQLPFQRVELGLTGLRQLLQRLRAGLGRAGSSGALLSLGAKGSCQIHGRFALGLACSHAFLRQGNALLHAGQNLAVAHLQARPVTSAGCSLRTSGLGCTTGLRYPCCCSGCRAIGFAQFGAHQLQRCAQRVVVLGRLEDAGLRCFFNGGEFFAHTRKIQRGQGPHQHADFLPGSHQPFAEQQNRHLRQLCCHLECIEPA